jgi:hypothetical protein
MGIKLHRGFESRPLRHNVEVRTNARREGLRRAGSALWSPFCVLGRDGLGFGQDALGETIGQQDGIRLGQLGAGDAHGHLAGGLVPFRRDVELGKERLVVAALELLIAGLVDGCHVLGQL